MGIRKNARFMGSTEREDFVRACVLLKADIVNPLAPAGAQYSKWDEYAAIHWMIQAATAPGTPTAVNFGHGGPGAYSFLSWHRHFLYRFELELQAKVPGVMLPYWDWTDLSPLLTDTFMGPGGGDVTSGYFAVDAPGTGTNPTPAPPWWPAGLAGWRVSSAFTSFYAGGLRRLVGSAINLPTATDLNETLAMTTYPAFQEALEGGGGLTSGHAMHNFLHEWVGGPDGHMTEVTVSPSDPLFYLHHCNIDRLWAMWQADGHATDYPLNGGSAQHNRNDILYPWVGATPGYGTTVPIAGAIPMPDFSALPIVRNVDTLDHRNTYQYTYDTIVTIGIGLDRTGSMLGTTPDPMTTSMPDVSKWVAATRGVSAFLQDCETVQASGVIYTIAGVETFRRLAANDFQPVFAAPGYGLIKTGSTFSRATFASAVVGMQPGGSTPLADALLDVKATLVDPPFGHAPADEPRYLAMLTDGLLTAGAPMNSIPDGSLSPVAVFSMGFGTGLDVDYATLQSMVDKGRALGTQQVFHGETAGTIDKFYSNALASAIGFSNVFDPVMELFAGEHTHVYFSATSADDTFLITAQGMDFNDANWSFHLHGPDETMVYGDGLAAAHSHGGHMGRGPQVTAKRASGRLSLVLNRDSADVASWVGTWRLMASYRARSLDGMVMFSPASLMAPVAAGTLRGPKYSRLLTNRKERRAQRNVAHQSAHSLDILPVGTNRNENDACDLAVNVYARTRLRYSLVPDTRRAAVGDAIAVQVRPDVLQGNVTVSRAFARMIAPASDIGALAARLNPKKIDPDKVTRNRAMPTWEAAKALADAERAAPEVSAHLDVEMKVASHDGGALHVHIEKARVAGPHHLAVYLDGSYCPDHDTVAGHDGHEHLAHDHAVGGAPASACGPDCVRERFSRLLTTLVPVAPL